MTEAAARPDPEALLRRIQTEARREQRGRLKIFLGYSAGVGKSFRMLDEGRRRMERGQDVVVGAAQPRTEAAAETVLRSLEAAPMRLAGGTPIMDAEAILRRRPEVCLVDGLAYDHPAGSPRAHRWEDIECLLEAGITVIATVNLQFIAERREEVERITGRAVTQTVPEELLRQADEIELVDAPPELAAPEDAGRRAQLAALREIALLLAAEVVEFQLEAYLRAHGLQPSWGTQERILVCITPEIGAARMIASAKRNAERFRGELLVAHVGSAEEAKAGARWRENVALARAAGAEVTMLEGDEFVAAILPFAHARGATQIYVGHSQHRKWWQRLAGSHLDRLIEHAEGIDVRVFPQ